jgi:glycosyltransferase involved in cell wall biosynthesis
MSTSPIRILGLTMERVTDFREHPSRKDAGLYAALDRRFSVVGVVRPVLPPIERYGNKLRHFHPDLEHWQSYAVLNPWVFTRQTAIAEQQLQEWDGRYDLIMQLHTRFAPGQRPENRPYVLTTDNTVLLSERYYPPWAHLRNQHRRDERVRLERMTYQNALFLFPWSEWARNSMIEDYDVPPEKVIAVGAGAPLVAPSIEGKRYDSEVAIFVGEAFERKGGVTLLRAWELVHRHLPSAQLWMVGQRRPWVEQPGVRWLGHIGDRETLAQLYTRAAVFVMPSLFEPWGHVFREAMGHGLPCIGADHCAMPEIIEHGATGLLVPPSQPEPLAAALVALLENPGYAEELGRRAYDHVTHGQTWDDMVARMAPYIEQAVAERVGSFA